jgi:ABC-type branched-subunit amino acid transport system substrate-binding protein
MKMVFRLAGVTMLAAASVSVFIAACGDDDTVTPGKQDAAVPDGVAPVGQDSAVPPKCPDAGAPVRTCTAAKCTTDLGEPAVCVDNACVKVKSRECQKIIGDVSDDNVILLGQMTDVNGPDKASGVGRTRAIELAIKEINDQTGGVVTADGCGKRPLAALVCEDSNTVLDVDAGVDGGSYDRTAAATHLAKELKVAAILGPHNSSNSIAVTKAVANPNKELLVLPTAGAAEITGLAEATVEGTRIVWRTVPTDALQAKAVARVGEKTQADIKAANANKTIKAAIVSRGDAFGRGLRDGIKAEFKLNGTTWGDASNTANIYEKEYVTPGAVPTTIKDELIQFQPDIVFFFGLGEIFNPVIGGFEDNNLSTNIDGGGTPIKPVWISSASGQRNELLTAISTRPDLRLRSRGTSSVLLTPLAADFFNIRFKVAYPDTKELVFGMAQSYDSVYLVAYAIGATKPAQTTQVSSFDVAKAMSNMTGGTLRVDVGPVKLKDGMEAVRKGDKIDFNGAVGPLDFDNAAGEAPGDYAVWCVRTDPNTGAPIFENATGMKWNFVSNQLEGTYNCQ